MLPIEPADYRHPMNKGSTVTPPAGYGAPYLGLARAGHHSAQVGQA